MIYPKHSFHIPVMGIGFTIDTPVKVAHYGIDSAISLVDDILMEKMRKYYCIQHELEYVEIDNKVTDYRAKRITAYLDLLQYLVDVKFESVRKQPFVEGSEISTYFELLPDYSTLKKQYSAMLKSNDAAQKSKLQEELRKTMKPGFIDVNIMTKLDKPNFIGKEQLSTEFNDAHAALRGYAQSKVNSSVIFSAGMNPRLYAYLEQFEDFYPNEHGEIKKRIILKVSDFKSANIQGKFLAKKGLWVSEYRIESGLNCGGHAFATDGYLMGPILQEFKENRHLLSQESMELLIPALTAKERVLPVEMPETKITAQGGIGSATEHEYLLKEYDLDSLGWGTPFLLVPEATNVDDGTLDLLKNSQEKDLYVSKISPLGVLFNSIEGNTKDFEKRRNIAKNRPGSSCPKKFLALNTEFTDHPICTASREYQFHKLKKLKEETSMPESEYNKQFDEITDKSCICVGLGTSALLTKKLDTKIEGEGVSICPGPNIAYFNRRSSLKEMIQHIYGKSNLLDDEVVRPHVFMKELSMYLDHLCSELAEPLTAKTEKKLQKFIDNLEEGVEYYKEQYSVLKLYFTKSFARIEEDLNRHQERLHNIAISHPM